MYGSAAFSLDFLFINVLEKLTIECIFQILFVVVNLDKKERYLRTEIFNLILFCNSFCVLIEFVKKIFLEENMTTFSNYRNFCDN